MENLKIKSTPKTPLINFDGSFGKLLISGRSIPVDPKTFWDPVLEWVENYLSNTKNRELEMTFDIEYLNISSSKRILFILYKLNNALSNGFNCRVVWKYRETDAHIKEVGQDYAFMVKVPFQFIAYKETQMANAV